MFFSHKIEDEKFILFSLFINNILNGKKEFSSKVDFVVKEAKALITGEKDYYSINRDNYPITVFLSRNADSFLQTINPDTLTDQDYKKLLEIIELQGSVNLA